MVSSQLQESLVCPACRLDVCLCAPSGDCLRCDGCGRQYPIVDGIPMMVVDELLVGGAYGSAATRVRGYYDTTADLYDQWTVDPPIDRLVDDVNWEEFRRFLGPRKLERCLDLACGTGRDLDRLLAIGESVIGVDISHPMLSKARKRASKAELICGEVTHLPLRDALFDLVVIDGSLHHFFAQGEAIAEACRVLSGGGLLVLLGG